MSYQLTRKLPTYKKSTNFTSQITSTYQKITRLPESDQTTKQLTVYQQVTNLPESDKKVQRAFLFSVSQFCLVRECQ